MNRFLIVDDHPLFRDALSGALQRSYPVVDIIEATTIKEALSQLRENENVDLALLDLRIPGVQGFEGLLEIRTHHPRLPIAIVSGQEDGRTISQALSYGVAGFISKSMRQTELASAIRDILDGAVSVPASYQPPSAEDLAEQENDVDTACITERVASLTPQQLRVLQMLRQGKLNKQIAFELQVGETTVKAHVSEILRKLRVYSRTQAVIEVSKLDTAELSRMQMHS